MKTSLALLLVALVLTIPDRCQLLRTTASKANEAVHVEVSPPSSSGMREDAALTVKLSNLSGDWLVKTTFAGVSTLQIDIHDQAGNVPRQTSFGCRYYPSNTCDKRPLRGSGYALVVEPSQTAILTVPIGKVYELQFGGVYRISVRLQDTALVQVPADFKTTSRTNQIAALSNYSRRANDPWPYVSLEPISSSEVTLTLN